jgi:hypothetical protein
VEGEEPTTALESAPDIALQSGSAGLFGKSGKVIGNTLDRNETNVQVHLPELRTIGTINSKCTFWWSVTTFITGAGLAFYLTGMTLEHPTPWQIALTHDMPVAFALFAAFSLIAAVREASHWKSEIFKIEREHGLPAETMPVRFRRWWNGKDV